MSMATVWYAAAGLLCVLFLYFIVKGKDSGMMARHLTAIVLWVIFISSLWTIHGWKAKQFLTGADFRIWSVYHYYLGSKYFDELGYHDLYTQTLAADKDSSRQLRSVNIIRNLHTLEKEPVEHVVINRSSRFSDKRWGDFKKDVDYFTSLKSGRFYGEVLCDRGYNPTPFWTFFGSFLTNTLDIRNSWHRMCLLSLDLILALLTAGICIWSFGASPTAVLFLVFILLPFNDKRLFGGILTYDWFYAMLLGLAFLNKNMGRSSALFWAYSAMSRVFPAVFILGIFITACRDFWKKGAIDEVNRRFVTAFAVFCCAGIILGTFNAYGPESWGTFRENISEHATQHVSGARRVGVKKILTVDFLSQAEASIEDNLEKNKALGISLQIMLVLGTVWVVLKKNKTDAMIWMLPVFFAFAVSSRYYWSVFGFLALLGATDNGKMPSPKGALFCFGGIIVWCFYSFRVVDPHQRYIFMNILLFIGFIVMTAWEIGRGRLNQKAEVRAEKRATKGSLAKAPGEKINRDRRSLTALGMSFTLILLLSIFIFLVPASETNLTRFHDWMEAYADNLKWEKRYWDKKLNRNILDESITAGTSFMLNNQTSEGNFNYEYDFLKKEMTKDDHQVRQAGALWGIALIYRYTKDHRLKEPLERSMRFFFSHTVEGPVAGAQVVAYPDVYICHTGTVALTAMAVIEYLRMEKEGFVTIDASFKKEMIQRLNGYIEHLKYLRLGDGHFSSAYFLPVRIKYPESSPYYDGETLLCLIKAARYLEYGHLIPIIEHSAIRLAKYYTMEQWRKASDPEMTKGFFQWGCMSFWEYQDAGWKDAHVMADTLISLAWWMIYKHDILTRQRNTAYAFEGIIHAYLLAKSRNHSEALNDLEFTIDRGLYKLTSWQVGGPLNSANPFLVKTYTYDPLAAGGIMNHSREAPLRIDVTQHQMHSALLAREHVYLE